MSRLTNKLKQIQKQQEEPLWKGPEVDGITQSMLSSFLVCRERFRVRYVLGLQPADDFNHRIEYGSMWHVCEEALAAGKTEKWADDLNAYCLGLCKKYPLRQEQIIHWYEVCKVQFPIYVKYWAKHRDVQNRTPLLQEEVFNVPYTLPSGRVVRLRGKFDSVDLIGKGKEAGIWLQENKTKGDIDEQQLQRQLTFDLQTMLYLVALRGLIDEQTTTTEHFQGASIKGIRYNVIRRPLAGGKGSIRQTKNETLPQFYSRLGDVIAEDPSYYFMRWQVIVTPEDIERFKKQCLNPLLELVCNWYECVVDKSDPFVGDPVEGYPWLHFQMPYGVYSPLIDGGSTDLDEYLTSGSTVGLHRAEKLFRELE